MITSRHNRRIVELRKLDARKHRQRQGRFLVEGLPILEMALAGRARPLEAYFCRELLAGPPAEAILDRLLAAGAEPVAVSADVMRSLADREAVDGVLAVFPLHEMGLSDLPADCGGLVVVLDRLQDPGNLGALIRTADAVGAKAAVLVEPCADPFDPKVVRGSMGSMFNVPLARTADVDGLFSYLRQHGARVVGTDAQRGRAWGEGLWSGSVALVLGNEARGLSDDVGDHVSDWARLPIAGHAESLNVAVAGGVLMYAWLRENLEKEYGSK